MTDSADFQTARAFMNFMVDYYALVRRHEIETNEYRTNSHGFSMLYALRKYQNQPITMTKFADEMGITKQQLTKLVNDLEDRNYVRRIHSKENRRQVYISITEEGLAYLEVLIGELVHELLRTMSAFSRDEKEQIRSSVTVLSELFRKDADMCRENREKKNG